METKIAQQLDYSKNPVSHGMLKTTRIIPLESSTRTTSTSGGEQLTFQIPAVVFNLARSYLNFNFAMPILAGASSNNDLHTNTIPIFRRFSLTTRSGLRIDSAEWLSDVLSVVVYPETQLDTLQTFPTADEKNAHHFFGSTNGTDITRVSGIVVDDIGTKKGNEPRLLSVKTSAAATFSVYASIPLSMFYNTILALDKNIYLGETINLTFELEPMTRFGYTSTGTATDFVAGAADMTAAPSLTNVFFSLATEKNPKVVQALMEKTSQGMSYLFDHTETFVISQNGTSHTQQVRLNRLNVGQRLKRIYHAVFNSTTNLNLAYDHSCTVAANAKGAPLADITFIPKLKTYYTQIDNQRLQDFNMTVGVDDWNELKPKLVGSCITDLVGYARNHFWCDDFTGKSRLYEKDDTEKIGLDLSIEKEYIVQCDLTQTGTWRHHTIAIGQKELVVSPQGIVVV